MNSSLKNKAEGMDRKSAEHDYEVNVKAELEIMTLHDKIEEPRDKKWSELISKQQEQLALLSQLLEDPKNTR